MVLVYSYKTSAKLDGLVQYNYSNPLNVINKGLYHVISTRSKIHNISFVK